MKTKKLLRVKETNSTEISKMWGFPYIDTINNTGALYIRCNAEGSINWSKNPIYNANELVERNVIIMH